MGCFHGYYCPHARAGGLECGRCQHGFVKRLVESREWQNEQLGVIFVVFPSCIASAFQLGKRLLSSSNTNMIQLVQWGMSLEALDRRCYGMVPCSC